MTAIQSHRLRSIQQRTKSLPTGQLISRFILVGSLIFMSTEYFISRVLFPCTTSIPSMVVSPFLIFHRIFIAYAILSPVIMIRISTSNDAIIDTDTHDNLVTPAPHCVQTRLLLGSHKTYTNKAIINFIFLYTT